MASTDHLSFTHTGLQLLHSWSLARRREVILFIIHQGSESYFQRTNTLRPIIVAPIGHCAEYEKASATILAVAVSSSALLFFFRIRAVFHNNRAVIGFYFILWLFVAGTAVASPFSVTGESIGPTRYRSDAGEKKFGFSLLIALLIHDTLVFAAMSYRLLCNSREEPTLRKQLGSFWSYQSLPRITSIILKDNQRYYACVSLSLRCSHTGMY